LTFGKNLKGGVNMLRNSFAAAARFFFLPNEQFLCMKKVNKIRKALNIKTFHNKKRNLTRGSTCSEVECRRRPLFLFHQKAILFI